MWIDKYTRMCYYPLFSFTISEHLAWGRWDGCLLPISINVDLQQAPESTL